MTGSQTGFEHQVGSVSEIRDKLQQLGADLAVLKVLPKNANDKNQVYFASSFTSLYNIFDLKLAERGASTSHKSTAKPGSHIPEAVFTSFEWLKADGSRIKAKNVKVIVYTQYPEARLSGFLSVENTMPHSLSIAFTKANPESKRVLVLGRLPSGACLAMICLDPSEAFLAEVNALAGLEGSRVCKLLSIQQTYSEQLLSQLAEIVSRPLKGCRLDKFGRTLPFTGTQVCGYTLEHALGIIPNSNQDGDLYGIELKTHTQLKTTLFTPEPDFGLYAESFEEFMRTYGYTTEGGSEYRVTGIHRANVRCKRTGLTLKVQEYHVAEPGNSKSDWVRDEQGNRVAFSYDPSTPLTSKMEAVEVVLVDDDGKIAAGWSFERLMNNWGAKHNKAVYISASKQENTSQQEVEEGYQFLVTYEPRVIVCEDSSAERLFEAIANGIIFLDPAPKFVPADPSKNKRRAQWRVNDITRAVENLYEHVRVCDLTNA